MFVKRHHMSIGARPAVAGQDVEAESASVTLVIVYDGIVSDLDSSEFCELGACIDIVAAFSAFALNRDAGNASIFRCFSTPKSRRIIDEWHTGVKRKISLSLNGIIDITRGCERAERMV